MKVHCESCKYLKKISSKYYCTQYKNIVPDNIDINYCKKGVTKNDRARVKQKWKGGKE